MKRKKVSTLEQFFAESSGRKVWIGVDVHKCSYSVAVYRDDGTMVSWKTSADNNALIRQLSSHALRIKVLAYESGPTGFGLARACLDAGIPAIVAAPNRIIRPVSPIAKTDRLDCRKLTELAAKNMVHSIAVPTKEEESLRALERRRHQLADSLRKVRQRIRGFLLFYGFQEPKGIDRWTNAAVAALMGMSMNEMLREVLDDYLDELKHLKEKITRLENAMVRQYRRHTSTQAGLSAKRSRCRADRLLFVLV